MKRLHQRKQSGDQPLRFKAGSLFYEAGKRLALCIFRYTIGGLIGCEEIADLFYARLRRELREELRLLQKAVPSAQIKRLQRCRGRQCAIPRRTARGNARREIFRDNNAGIARQIQARVADAEAVLVVVIAHEVPPVQLGARFQMIGQVRLLQSAAATGTAPVIRLYFRHTVITTHVTILTPCFG